MTITVKQVGGSLAVIIPKSLANDMGLAKGSQLVVTSEMDAITMRKPCRRARRPLAELVKQMDRAAYKRINAEFEADGPVGREIW